MANQRLIKDLSATDLQLVVDCSTIIFLNKMFGKKKKHFCAIHNRYSCFTYSKTELCSYDYDGSAGTNLVLSFHFQHLKFLAQLISRAAEIHHQNQESEFW